MDAKIGLIAVVAVLAGAVTGGMVTANFVPSADQVEMESADTEALDVALREAAESRAEAIHWQSEADRLARELAAKPDAVQAKSPTPTDVVVEVGENDSSTMDASMRAELEEYRERDREREDRFADRRGQMQEWQNEMVDRRVNKFTELIERSNDPVEQQRWADIEKQMTLAQDLFRQMRDAETDEQRFAVRGEIGENFEVTQSLLKEQQNAVLGRALQAEGITDTDQLTLIQSAVQASMEDDAFQMSPFGPGRRGPGGGGPPGRGGGPGRGRPGGGPPGPGR